MKNSHKIVSAFLEHHSSPLHQVCSDKCSAASAIAVEEMG
jgi:hypothetical protein